MIVVIHDDIKTREVIFPITTSFYFSNKHQIVKRKTMNFKNLEADVARGATLGLVCTLHIEKLMCFSLRAVSHFDISISRHTQKQ